MPRRVPTRHSGARRLFDTYMQREEFMLMSYLEGRALHSPYLSVSVPQSQASSPGKQDQLSPLQLILHSLSSQFSISTPDANINARFAVFTEELNYISPLLFHVLY